MCPRTHHSSVVRVYPYLGSLYISVIFGLPEDCTTFRLCFVGRNDPAVPCCFQRGTRVRDGIGLGRELQPHRWPIAPVVDDIKRLSVQLTADPHPLWLTGACAEVANEDDVSNVCDVASLQNPVEIPGTELNVSCFIREHSVTLPIN